MYSDSDDDYEPFEGDYDLRTPTPPPDRPRTFLPGERDAPILSLPDVCFTHKTGCTRVNCGRLHICQLFLAGICNFGASCRLGHGLITPHNAAVCRAHGLDPNKEQVIVQLAARLQENNSLPDETYRRHLEVCFKYKAPNGSCEEGVCNRLHICRRFVSGNCEYYDEGCRFGHSLHTTHNNDVLSRHKVSSLRDFDIMAMLREKLKGNERQAAGAGAVPREAGTRRGATRRAPPARGGTRRTEPRQPRAGPDQAEQPAPVPAPPEDTLKASGIAEEVQCPVCLGLLERATTLGCGHSFCAECIASVQLHDPKCPVCRTHIRHSIRSVMLDNIISGMAKLKTNVD